MCQLQKQYNFYQQHKESINAQYLGKCIVISDSLEVFAFPDRLQAYTFGAMHYGLGHFFMQECKEGGIGTINSFSSLPYLL